MYKVQVGIELYFPGGHLDGCCRRHGCHSGDTLSTGSMKALSDHRIQIELEKSKEDIGTEPEDRS